MHGHVTEALAAGARALTGGEVPDGQGSYYPPTVLIGCTPQMRVMREETFGPVAPVRVVPDFDAALLEAVHDDYGLAATVLTPDMAHAQAAWRALPVGTVKVNNVFGGAPGGAAQPRRGSGTGFGYGPELLDEMTTTKVVHVAAPPAAERAAESGTGADGTIVPIVTLGGSVSVRRLPSPRSSPCSRRRCGAGQSGGPAGAVARDVGVRRGGRPAAGPGRAGPTGRRSA